MTQVQTWRDFPSCPFIYIPTCPPKLEGSRIGVESQSCSFHLFNNFIIEVSNPPEEKILFSLAQFITTHLFHH